jgi:NADPH:quinone reductase-like Zn-dependent oxidoreductase
MGNTSEFHTIVQELAHGHLYPPIDATFPLEHARPAFERLAAAAQFGKIVIHIAPHPLQSPHE